MDKEYITVEQLCEWLKISRRTTERWRKEEGMPFIRKGRSIRFDKQVVIEWLEKKNGNK